MHSTQVSHAAVGPMRLNLTLLACLDLNLPPQLVARRVDIICSLVLLVGYIICVSVIIAVSSGVGDHK